MDFLESETTSVTTRQQRTPKLGADITRMPTKTGGLGVMYELVMK
jgi:hypothetical protein